MTMAQKTALLVKPHFWNRCCFFVVQLRLKRDMETNTQEQTTEKYLQKNPSLFLTAPCCA